jgi:redox-sensitive bicupin YhaK (pirin superfamily)
MKKRTISKILPSHIAGGGGRVFIKQPLPHPALEQHSPFVLLHHFGPVTLAPGEESLGFGAHPHRGFMPVTFLFDGAGHHKDSLGNEGEILAGGVQWLNAASGVIHAETQPESFNRSGGIIEGIQLWINLPAALKKASPTYINIPADRIPLIEADGFTVKVVSGKFGEAIGIAKPPIQIDSFMIEMEPNATLELPARNGWNAMLFNLHGDISIEGKKIGDDELAVLSDDGESVVISSEGHARLLYLAGEPIDEPMVSYGPFVMNTEEEIRQAYADYKAGRMGKVG